VEPDVVVVGGGAIGVTAAYELAQRGARVTLLEREASLGAGCSSGNAGLISPSHSAPLATPDTLRSLLRPDGPLGFRPALDSLPWLARFALACRADRAEHSRRILGELTAASLELHAELAALGTSFERRGIVAVYSGEAAFVRARREAEPPVSDTSQRQEAREQALSTPARASEPPAVSETSQRHLRDRTAPARVLGGTQAAEVEPALRSGLAGAVLHPAEGHVNPARYVDAVGAAAASAGAELRTGVEVRALRRWHGGLALDTVNGELRPQTVVLAAGVWASGLARGLGLRLPLTGGKGYHVDLEAGPGDPVRPLLVPETRTAITPLDGRLRLTGTLEIAGLDASLRPSRVELVRRAAEVLRDVGERRTLDVWAGLRPCTPDGLPTIGLAAPGVVVATGHAMKGIALAPVTARLVAELAAGETPSHDLAPFDHGRFN
jgi:D-amino-acid dehydrogenase